VLPSFGAKNEKWMGLFCWGIDWKLQVFLGLENYPSPLFLIYDLLMKRHN
jgi:hypothetical protein